MFTKRFALLIVILALAALVLYLHVTALENFWYWKFSWFDTVMHFLGGVIVSGCAVWVWSIEKPLGSLFHTLLVTAAAILLVGIGWEIFEVGTGVQMMDVGYPLDTALDLVMDTLGTAIGTVLAWFLLRPRAESVEIVS